jgi:serine/threonine protein kinase
LLSPTFDSPRCRLGEGSFGYVVAAKDTVTGKRVAIKKIKDAMEDEQDGKRYVQAFAGCFRDSFCQTCL